MWCACLTTYQLFLKNPLNYWNCKSVFKNEKTWGSFSLPTFSKPSLYQFLLTQQFFLTPFSLLQEHLFLPELTEWLFPDKIKVVNVIGNNAEIKKSKHSNLFLKIKTYDLRSRKAFGNTKSNHRITNTVQML